MAPIRIDAFEFEIVCRACGRSAGTFVAADPFADEPHACPTCGSPALSRRGRELAAPL